MIRATPARYCLAAALFLAAFLPWLTVQSIAPSPFIFLIVAVALSAYWGGIGPGIVTGVLGALATMYFYLPPKHTLALDSLQSALELAVYLLVTGFSAWLSDRQARHNRRLAELLERERESLSRLEEADSRLRTIIQASPLPIVSLDLDGNITMWNEVAERTFGWTEEEVLGKPSPTIPPEDRPASDAVFQRVLRGESVTDLHRRRVKKDGSPIDLSISTAPLKDAHGRVMGTVIISQDITQRVQSEEERARLLQSEQEARAQAEESRRRFEFLAKASDLLASSLDYEATLKSVARLAVPHIADWCSVHIVEDDGSVRPLATEHVDPAKVEMAEQLAREYPFDPDAPGGAAAVIRTGEPELIPDLGDELLEAVSPDERILRILRDLGLSSSMVVPMIARGRTVGAITFVSAEMGRRYTSEDLDLAQELGNRAALAVDNARLYREVLAVAAQQATILERMVDGVIIADAAGTTTFMNDAARELLGVASLNVPLERHQEAYHLFTPDGQPYPSLQLPLSRAAVFGEIVQEGEIRVRRPGGVELIVEASAGPIITADGVRLGGVATLRDVTVQRTLERQKDEFLSAAAHDLKNPLATIKTLAQLMRRRMERAEPPDVPRLLDGLERIDTTATRMAALINELLDATRLQMGQPIELDRCPCDLVSLLRQVVDEQRSATERHDIEFDTTCSELVGVWDAQRLERAVSNLVANAVKYSPDGGSVTVRLSVEGEPPETSAVVTVQDHGIGIPEDEIDHVFERFFRARNVVGHIAGTGIGLAGVRQIVEEHGGSVAVESRMGTGSTFTLRMPLALDEATDLGGLHAARREA